MKKKVLLLRKSTFQFCCKLLVFFLHSSQDKSAVLDVSREALSVTTYCYRIQWRERSPPSCDRGEQILSAAPQTQIDLKMHIQGHQGFLDKIFEL